MEEKFHNILAHKVDTINSELEVALDQYLNGEPLIGLLTLLPEEKNPAILAQTQKQAETVGSRVISKLHNHYRRVVALTGTRLLLLDTDSHPSIKVTIFPKNAVDSVAFTVQQMKGPNSERTFPVHTVHINLSAGSQPSGFTFHKPSDMDRDPHFQDFCNALRQLFM